MGEPKRPGPWFHWFRWVMLAVVFVNLAGGVEAGITRDLPAVVRSLGQVAFYLCLWVSVAYAGNTRRAPQIWVLQAFLLAAATGAFLWLWRLTHAGSARGLLVAVALFWAGLGFQWFRHRPR